MLNKKVKMDALFDKVIKGIKEVGLPSIMCCALGYFIWHQNIQWEIKDTKDRENTQILLNTISKNTEAFNYLSAKIDKLAESIEIRK